MKNKRKNFLFYIFVYLSICLFIYLFILLCEFSFTNIQFLQNSKGRRRSFLNPVYHFQLFNISRAITAESSPLRMK